MSDSPLSRSRRAFLRQWLARQPNLKAPTVGPTQEAIQADPPDAPEAPQAPDAADAHPADGQAYLLHIARRAMATEFQVFLNAGQHSAGPEAAVLALDLLDALEDQLSIYRPHSEVSRLNQSAHLRPAQVESRLFDLLQLACEIHRETEGAFDITASPLSKAWGFHQRQGRIPDASALRDALQRVGSQWLQLDTAWHRVAFKLADLELNLGGIGKGYALDRCASALREHGVHDFLLQGGLSSVLAQGLRLRSDSMDQRTWKIGLTHPLTPRKRLGEVLLRDQALGTSGCGNQYFFHQGQRYGHILDPRTGFPAVGVYSATVLAPTAARADALATAFYVMGPAKAQAYCDQHAEIGAVLAVAGDRHGELRIEVMGNVGDAWRPAIDSP